MHAGRFSERVTIRRKVVARDNMGGETITWVDDAEIWACAEPLHGREYAAFAQGEAEMIVRFTLHYKTGITPDSRIVWRETVYEMTSPPIDVNAKKQWLELMARTTKNA